MLEISGLSAGYGKIEILKGISFKVPAGKIVSLIGSNGAGKTTTLMTVSGIVRAKHGEIRFDGKNIAKRKPEEIVRLGVVQVPEGRRIFQHLSIEENLDLGAYTRAAGDSVHKEKEEIFQMFPILKERAKGLAGNLSGGEQQMLAMGRALMAKPRVLLLDEPSLGLAPKMVDVVFSLIRTINKKGITILLVEQNAFKALELAHHAYVIESGQIEIEGSGRELLASSHIKKAYLGG